MSDSCVCIHEVENIARVGFLPACSFAYAATFGTFTVSDDEGYSIATMVLFPRVRRFTLDSLIIMGRRRFLAWLRSCYLAL
jgi:hypothetical protein